MGTDVVTQELWRNGMPGTVVVQKSNLRGEFLNTEIVGGDQLLHITSLDRQLNQEKIVDESLDPFLNGMLIPVHIDESDPMSAKILANPNLVTEDAAAKLVKATSKVLVERLDQITNVLTLERIYAAAVEADVSLRRAQAIRDRITAVRTAGVHAPTANEQEAAAKVRGRNGVPRGLDPLAEAPKRVVNL